jgi:hypothetical protein
MRLKSRNEVPDLTELDNTSDAAERIYDWPELHCHNDFPMGRNQVVPNKPRAPCISTLFPNNYQVTTIDQTIMIDFPLIGDYVM